MNPIIMETSVERNGETTPTEMLIQNVKKLDENKRPVVLLATGGFNPAHIMHINMFVNAKNSVEKNPNFEVVGGFISPSHDEYVTKKLTPYSTIPQHHRVNILNVWIRELEHDNWLFVDQGESKHHKFVDHCTVLQSLRKYLLEVDECLRNLKVMYLAGRDLWLRTRGMGNLQVDDYGVVVMWREETKDTATTYHRKLEKELLEKIGENLIIVDPVNTEDENFKLSSTKIRKYLKEKRYDEVDQNLLIEPVIEYSRKNELLQEAYFCSQRMRDLFAPYIEQREKERKKKEPEAEGCIIL